MVAATIALLVAGGCAAPSEPGAVTAAPTYLADVRPILMARCAPCHDDPTWRSAPSSVPAYFRLDSWDRDTDPAPDACDAAQVATCGVEGMIATDDGSGHDLLTRRAAIDGTMPPDGPLPAEERDLLERWAAAGHPKGTRANTMPSIAFTTPVAGDTVVDQTFTVEVQVDDSDGDTVIWDLRWRDAQGATGLLVRDLPAGGASIPIDTSGMASGTYTLEAVLVDGVGTMPVVQSAAGTLTVPAGRNAAPTVSVLEPAGGELYDAASTVAITWTAADADSPALSGALAAIRSSDGARVELTQFATLPAASRYDWTPGDLAPGQYTIELTVSDGTSSRSARSGEFSVQGAPQAVSYSGQIQPILTTSCAGSGCHNGSTIANKHLDLRAGMALASLVGVDSAECPATKRVDPGAPSTSYLMWKLQGSGPCFSGSKMPKTGSLSAADLALVDDWIANGAPSN
jgi:hypothetical protein